MEAKYTCLSEMNHAYLGKYEKVFLILDCSLKAMSFICRTHCAGLHLIPFEEDASDFF